jgi:hypothetical protein
MGLHLFQAAQYNCSASELNNADTNKSVANKRRCIQIGWETGEDESGNLLIQRLQAFASSIPRHFIVHDINCEISITRSPKFDNQRWMDGLHRFLSHARKRWRPSADIFPKDCAGEEYEAVSDR